MAHEQTEKFARALRDLRANDPALTRLSLYKGDMKGEEESSLLADALRFNSTLVHLCLCYNNIGDEGASALAEALSVNSTLVRLDLCRNNIGDGGASALAEALRVNSTLRALYLENNGIGDEGARVLADSLHVNSTLRILILYKNNIDGGGVRALTGALHVNSTLLKLITADFDSGEIWRYLQRNRHNARVRAMPLRILCWQAVLKLRLNDPVQIALVPPVIRNNSTSLLRKINSEFPFY